MLRKLSAVILVLLSWALIAALVIVAILFTAEALAITY